MQERVDPRCKTVEDHIVSSNCHWAYKEAWEGSIIILIIIVIIIIIIIIMIIIIIISSSSSNIIMIIIIIVIVITASIIITVIMIRVIGIVSNEWMGVGPLPKKTRDFHLLQRELCDTCEWDTHLFRNLPHTHLLVTDYSGSVVERDSPGAEWGGCVRDTRIISYNIT